MAPEVEEYFPTTETSAENALHQAQKIHKTEHVETEPKDQAASKSHKGRGRPRKKSVVAVDEKPKSTSTKQPSTVVLTTCVNHPFTNSTFHLKSICLGSFGSSSMVILWFEGA